MRKLLLGACLTGLLTIAHHAHAQMLPLREQAAIINQLTRERLDSLLPALMDSTGIDCWIVISREYNEDPVIRTLLPAEWLSARRRTIFLFCYDRAARKLEKLAIARYSLGEGILPVWDTQKFPDQWDALVDQVVRHAPRNIAIDISRDFAHADGLDHTDHEELMRKLPAAYRSRVVPAGSLAIGWLETRTMHEMQIYPQLIHYTHAVIAEAFSEKVILPGVTTTEDVEWWLRQRIRDDGYDTWFHPSVTLQRTGDTGGGETPAIREGAQRILPGDLLHVDFGITYLRLNTDIQEHAYVLRPGEREAPVGLRDAFARAGRLQDILTGEFAVGRTGNQILAAALAKARAEGIEASIYTHPIGYHGHAAGPTIGLWDQQGGVPGSGDYPMHYNTAYSIELNAVSRVPEWNKQVRMMLEEDGYFGVDGFRFIEGRQKDIYLIPRSLGSIIY